MITKKFYFTNHNGTKLNCVLDLPGGHERVPVVIFCHGFLAHKNRLFARSMSRNLVRQGYAVLRYDLPGHSQSGGKKNEVTFPGSIEDITQLIDLLVDEPRIQKDKISLVGHSFGGIIALVAAAYESRIRTVVAISAALDFRAIINNLLRVKKMTIKEGCLSYNFIPILPKQKCHQQLYSYSQSFSVAKIKSKIRVPLLLIHGDKDNTIPLNLAEETIATFPRQARLVVVPGQGHLFLKPGTGKKLAQIISDWLNQDL